MSSSFCCTLTNKWPDSCEPIALAKVLLKHHNVVVVTITLTTLYSSKLLMATDQPELRRDLQKSVNHCDSVEGKGRGWHAEASCGMS